MSASSASSCSYSASRPASLGCRWPGLRRSRGDRPPGLAGTASGRPAAGASGPGGQRRRHRPRGAALCPHASAALLRRLARHWRGDAVHDRGLPAPGPVGAVRDLGGLRRGLRLGGTASGRQTARHPRRHHRHARGVPRAAGRLGLAARVRPVAARRHLQLPPLPHAHRLVLADAGAGDSGRRRGGAVVVALSVPDGRWRSRCGTSA